MQDKEIKQLINMLVVTSEMKKMDARELVWRILNSRLASYGGYEDFLLDEVISRLFPDFFDKEDLEITATGWKCGDEEIFYDLDKFTLDKGVK